MSVLRRYEIFLPKRFNDGSTVPPGLHGEVVIALRQRFGAVSSETQTIKGLWQQGGVEYSDDLVRIFVDAEDTGDNRRFFIDLKERLKERFRQIDIWITSYSIETI